MDKSHEIKFATLVLSILNRAYQPINNGELEGALKQRREFTNISTDLTKIIQNLESLKKIVITHYNNEELIKILNQNVSTYFDTRINKTISELDSAPKKGTINNEVIDKLFEELVNKIQEIITKISTQK